MHDQKSLLAITCRSEADSHLLASSISPCHIFPSSLRHPPPTAHHLFVTVCGCGLFSQYPFPKPRLTPTLPLSLLPLPAPASLLPQSPARLCISSLIQPNALSNPPKKIGQRSVRRRQSRHDVLVVRANGKRA